MPLGLNIILQFRGSAVFTTWLRLFYVLSCVSIQYESSDKTGYEYLESVSSSAVKTCLAGGPGLLLKSTIVLRNSVLFYLLNTGDVVMKYC